MRTRLVLLALPLFAGCAIPERDNPRDPAIVPRARVSVSVDGVPTSVGSRRSPWRLDGTGSSDPDDAITRFEWWFSPDLDTDPQEDEGWTLIPSDAADVDVETGNTAFIDLLTTLVDFGVGEGVQPIGARQCQVRLVVRDGDGHRGVTAVPIVVVNNAPSVSLGPDRRIAPGGLWWTVDKVSGDVNDDGVADVLDAPRRIVTVHAAIGDPDPGEVGSLGAEHVRWYVSGALAEALDLDSDGEIDADRFDDPLHRRLSFAAPLFPARSRLRVEVSDTIDADGALVAPASNEITVDVASTRWVGDVATSTLQILPTAAFSSQPVPVASANTAIAAAGGRILAVRDSPVTTGARVEAVTHRLDLACGGCYRDITRTANLEQILATGDGHGGWWVLDQQFGELHHLRPDLSSFPAAPFSDLDGDLASDLVGADTLIRDVSAGATRVWVTGGSAAADQLFLISTGGLVSSTPLGASYAQLAIAPGGGGWIFSLTGGASKLERFDPAGTITLSEDITQALPQAGSRPLSLQFDARRDLVWGLYSLPFTGQRCVFRRDARGLAGGGFLTTCTPFAGDEIHADLADGTLIAEASTGALGFLGRFDPELNLVGVLPVGEGVVIAGALLAEGSVVADVNEAGNVRRTWIEQGTLAAPPPATFVSGLHATGIATDPETGAAWVWSSSCACLVEVHPDGSVARSVDLGIDGVGEAALAIDPASRRLWAAWTAAGSAGLSYVDLSDAPDATLAPVTTPLTGPAIIHDVDVVPGGQVCVSGELLTDPSPIGWVYRPDTGTTVPVSTGDATSIASRAAADALSRGCYFLPVPSNDNISARAGYLGPTGTTPITPLNTLNSTSGDPRPFVGGAMDYFTASNPRLWVLNEHSQDSFPTRIFTFYDFVVSTTYTVGGPSFSLSDAGPFDELSSLDFDPFYRHFYVGIGNPFANPSIAGSVRRIDAATSFYEVDRFDGFLGPTVSGTP